MPSRVDNMWISQRLVIIVHANHRQIFERSDQMQSVENLPVFPDPEPAACHADRLSRLINRR